MACLIWQFLEKIAGYFKSEEKGEEDFPAAYIKCVSSTYSSYSSSSHST